MTVKQRAVAVGAWTAGLAAGGLVLPALVIAGGPVHSGLSFVGLAVVIVALCYFLGTRVAATRVLAIVGLVMTAAACFALAQASYSALALFLAPPLGVGLAFSGGGLPKTRAGVACAGVAIAVVLLSRVAAGREGAAAVTGVFGAAAACGALLRGEAPTRGATALFGALGLLLALITVSYAGATTPRAAWFGSLVSHGPRDGNLVAITFDDGPNPPYTLEIKDILDRYGVKATFFSVGKAVDARPDVSAALLADGQLLGNHSYLHDAFRWLDPRYTELGRAENAINRNLGVCPAFFRPPHGEHTPFMSLQAGRKSMHVVTWDDSAGDWATTDGNLVAERILSKVRPGSIILLHDGIDGNIGADRSVVLEALPQIIEGLKARGLQPVTLDKLLGNAGYVKNC